MERNGLTRAGVDQRRGRLRRRLRHRGDMQRNATLKATARRSGPVDARRGRPRASRHDDIRRLRHPLVGGVILFARNFESPRPADVRSPHAIQAARPGVLIASTTKAGACSASSEGFTRLPPMRRARRAVGQAIAAGATRCRARVRLRARPSCGACGVDLSFTPVLDLDYGESGVIGDRAFRRDPRVVGLARREPEPRPGAGRHGERRQAFSGSRLRAGRFAPRDSRRRAQPHGHPARADAVPFECLGMSAGGGDAGARDLSAGGHTARGLLAQVDADPAREIGFDGRDLLRRPLHGRRQHRRRRGPPRRGGACGRLRHGPALQFARQPTSCWTA